MNKVSLVSMLFTSLTLLTACGGGSSGSSNVTSNVNSTAGSGSNDAVAGVSPLVALSSSAQHTLNLGGANTVLTYTTSSGFAGEVEAEVVTASFGDIAGHSVVTTLMQGTPSMNIVDIQRMRAVDFTCDDGSVYKGTISTVFSSGEEVSTGTINNQPLSCSSKYTVVVPRTVSDETSIEDLLLAHITGIDNSLTNVIESDCPDDEFIDLVNLNANYCDGVELRNFTITDDTGGIHKQTVKIEVEYSD